MSHKIIETTTHDYNPVNKYIDEKARLKRTKRELKREQATQKKLHELGWYCPQVLVNVSLS